LVRTFRTAAPPPPLAPPPLPPPPLAPPNELDARRAKCANPAPAAAPGDGGALPPPTPAPPKPPPARVGDGGVSTLLPAPLARLPVRPRALFELLRLLLLLFAPPSPAAVLRLSAVAARSRLPVPRATAAALAAAP